MTEWDLKVARGWLGKAAAAAAAAALTARVAKASKQL